MSSTVAEYVGAYAAQFRSDPHSADRELLTKALLLHKAALQEDVLTQDTVHAGFELLDRLGERAELLTLLRRYLKQPLTTDERAWAWWQLVDSLAVLHQCDNVVAEQTALRQWADEHLTGYKLNLAEQFPYHPLESSDNDKTIAPESVLLWVMHDGTQAKCWVESGRADAWFALAQSALDTVVPTARNRFQRFNFLRTFSVAAAWDGQKDKGLRAAEQITLLANEEMDWELAQKWNLEGLYVAMRVYVEARNTDKVRALGQEAIAIMEAVENRCAPLTMDQQGRLGDNSHNIACPLRGMGQYDLAIPLFERAIALQRASTWTYLYYAASVWATTQDRQQTLALLREAGARSSEGNLWQEAQRDNLLPEFTDAGVNSDFERAANGHTTRGLT